MILEVTLLGYIVFGITCFLGGFNVSRVIWEWKCRKSEQRRASERIRAINEWLDIHCRKCVYNDDRGTDFVNCQAECEVQKGVGIACIHHEEYIAESEE